MAAPRHQLVDPAAPGYYHCVTRCVRRAFLCGLDQLSGRSFDHRKTWIESRLIELAGIFAVGLYAYAVMSNHVHAVIHVDPGTVSGWPDAEVAERWVRLFPARANGEIDPEGCLRRRDAILGNPECLAECRTRLGCVSWFMRCLAEPIARRANREDGCTGRFWEGRFKCQALLDVAAVLSCMSYVDLNPIRAGIAPDLPSSAHTSIKRRIETAHPQPPTEPLRAIAASIAEPALPVGLAEYLNLVDWTGRIARPDKRGTIRGDAPPILGRIGLQPRQWQVQVLGTENRYWRAIGAVDQLLEKAAAIGQRWLKGIGTMRALQARPRVSVA
jgi:REP element-mobilizing transposase RayT